MKIAASQSRGFTLVELMIVVAIIGMLAAIAIPSFVRARTQSQTSACINNLRQIDDATQEWAMENNQMPSTTVIFPNISSYLKSAVLCPAAGNGATFAICYTLTTVGNKPTCNLYPATHILPPDTSASGPPHPTAP